MKKRYILILSMLIVVLSISYVSAVDNSTDISKEQSNDLISINEDDISLSSEVNEPVSLVNENSSGVNETNDGGLLGVVETDNALAASSNDVLSSCVNVTPLGSSDYKTPTKQQRTFNIAGFKATLTQSQYKKLYQISSVEDEFFDDGYNEYYYVGEKFRGYGISSTGLYHSRTVKTNKYIKVKVKIGNKYKIKKTRAYMMFVYGAGQCGIAYRYIAFLTHKYANPGYDYFKVIDSNAKYFAKCKHSTSFTELNKSKLYNIEYVYKKYG